MVYTPKNFVNLGQPIVDAGWLNGVDQMVNNVLGGTATVSAVQAALGVLPAASFTQAAIEALLYPTSVAGTVSFDTSQTQVLIGQSAGSVATNLWLSTGTATTRLQEFANAFEYVASGGGTFNDDTKWGVALYAAAKLTGGSRSISAINAVAEVDIAGQASAFSIEADFNNNSGADVGLTTNAYDQMVGVRSASGGNYKPQVAVQTVALSAASRWRIGEGIANWSDYGLVIVQDPGTVTTDASGTNTGTAGAAVTGPAIILQASSNGGVNPLFKVLGLDTLPRMQILQNGQVQVPNNLGFDFLDSAGTPQTAMIVDGSNNLYVLCSPTGPGGGNLADSGLNVKFGWNATGIGFYGATPIAQITGYGSPTGGAHQGSFAAGSITLANLAAGFAQLIVDLENLGLVHT